MEAWDEEGNKYYENPTTGESSWDFPVGAAGGGRDSRLQLQRRPRSGGRNGTGGKLSRMNLARGTISIQLRGSHSGHDIG